MRPWIAAAVMAALVVVSSAPFPSAAAPAGHPQISSVSSTSVDRVGDVEGEGTHPIPVRVTHDTVWIADWTFDVFGGGCTDAGWVNYDNRILHDGSNYWSVNASFSGFGAITGQAAVLAKHDLTWVRDGYGNNWDYSIILKYQGASTLSFDYLSDSEPGDDFVTVEADSAGASESRVDYTTAPADGPAAYRSELMSVSGSQAAIVGGLALPDFGVPATVHEVYIRFASNFADSDEDGMYPTTWNAGLVVDDIVVTGSLAYAEGFEGALNPNITLANTASATPFGEWARLYPHITDNDLCTENTTCAWLWSDPSLPALIPDMAFGPGAFVVRNWLDDVIVSPWVSLLGTPGATGTVVSYRRFPGNDFSKGRIVLGWSVRSMVRVDNTDTSTPGDSIDAVAPWGHSANWNSLTLFFWMTSIADMTAYVPSGAQELQVRFRVSDWQYINGAAPPSPFDPGPGPYIDRVRIGRHFLTGPVFNPGIDLRWQAQDCFPTYRNSIPAGEHFSPSTDRFGTCAFTIGSDLTAYGNPVCGNVVTGDSITMHVSDERNAGGVTAVRWYGVIVEGPHQGKAPSPYAVGGNGFFEVTPDSARGSSGGVVKNAWFVDLDDTYFRGGDGLLYFWTAVDAAGGRASFPDGITAANFPPASPQAAELATGGLIEVSFLPQINWSPSYLARIAADAHGDLDPTPAEIAASEQSNCILYYAAGYGFWPGRRSGETHRTSFMYTLDRLGYRDHYDVYDHQGLGNTNNHLGGRATVEQCSGYALIIHDGGRVEDLNLPDGFPCDVWKVDQCQWYRDYLAQGSTGLAGIASLWLIGEDAASERPNNALVATDFGLASIVDDQGLAVSPEVAGQTSFTFSNGNLVDFTGESFTLDGGCPDIRDYDGALGSGTAVVTHRYANDGATGTGAIVMNANAVAQWNTIWMGFNWFDIVVPQGGDPASVTGGPDTRLARTILNAVLPAGCAQGENPTGVPDDETDAVPEVTVLHPNVPNPFNPTTTIRFDLARDGRVQLRIYDVAGRLVKTLVDEDMTRGFGKHLVWTGLDESGSRVASGVYLCRLVTVDESSTRKMVLLE